MKSKTQKPFRLTYFTLLRYPGGKGKLAAFVKQLIIDNELGDGEYVEPYAGGAAIALELLIQEYVSRIHINDISKPIHSFWYSVLHKTEELCRLVRDTPLTVANWDRQKAVFSDQANQAALELGFATFFLNRTNRSGILNGGIIGGRDQSGPWKIDARYNAPELVARIQAIAKMKSRISLSRKDAVKFVSAGCAKWPAQTLIYLDPPYYVKGRELYYDFYSAKDHQAIADIVQQIVSKQNWIVSYDNVPEIRAFYPTARMMTYSIGYSARSSKQGSEVMFFSARLSIPPACGSMTSTRIYTARAA